MVRSVTLEKVGDAVGVSLPAEVLSAFRLGVNDTVFIVATPHGILLTPSDPATMESLDAFVDALRDTRKALDALSGQQ